MTTPDPTTTTEYHWIITIGWPTPRGGAATVTISNTYSVLGQIRRQDAFAEILQSAVEMTGAVKPNVLFFSLEPNRLG